MFWRLSVYLPCGRQNNFHFSCFLFHTENPQRRPGTDLDRLLPWSYSFGASAHAPKPQLLPCTGQVKSRQEMWFRFLSYCWTARCSQVVLSSYLEYLEYVLDCFRHLSYHQVSERTPFDPNLNGFSHFLRLHVGQCSEAFPNCLCLTKHHWQASSKSWKCGSDLRTREFIGDHFSLLRISSAVANYIPTSFMSVNVTWLRCVFPVHRW